MRVPVCVACTHVCVRAFFSFSFRISNLTRLEYLSGAEVAALGRTCAYKTRGEHRPLTSTDLHVIARESELDFIT
jgi:hypothetical protein